MDKEYKAILQELTIAGYLFAFDELASKAEENSIFSDSSKLQKFLPDCLNAERIINLVRKQKNPVSFEETCLSEGIRIAFGGDKWNPSYKVKPLVSLLSTLSIDNRKKTKKTYYKVGKLTPEGILGETGITTISKDSYKILYQEFMKDFSNLGGVSQEDYLSVLDNMLLQYLWCIPAVDDDNVDISLYQISKLSASFASILYRYHISINRTTALDVKTDGEKFRFINGDISGIQKYIFDLKSAEHNAKLLRAKSFELLAISQILSDNLVSSFDGSVADIITASGGKFIVAVPNINSVTEMLPILKTEYETYFLREYTGKLDIVISEGTAATAGNLCEKKDTVKLILDIGYDGDIAKQSKMQNALQKNGPVLDELYEQLEINGVCPCCGINPSLGDGRKCSKCDSLIEIGKNLIHAQSIKIKSGRLKPFGEMIDFDFNDEDKSFAKINEYVPGRKILYLPYVAPWKDSKERELKTFEEIAAVPSNGNNKLAMFKSDIDNLGLVFSSSLGENMCFARYAEMSRLFHYFFSVYYADFVKKNYENQIYTVFSGGDDLCVIGNWKDIMKFAADFHKKMELFTNSNPSVTLSAGISLFSSSIPVRFMAQNTEEQLETSKGRKENGSIVKNAVTVFDTTVSWEEYDLQLVNGNKIEGYLRDKIVPTAPVYKMINFSERAKAAENGSLDPRNLMWRSNFKYIIARNLSKNDKSVQDFFGNEIGKNIIKSKIAVSYGLYTQRKGL